MSNNPADLTGVMGEHTHFTHMHIQGVFFNWSYPKNHKYGKKLKYQNWSSPKIHKYQNWSPPQKTETRTIVFHSRENPGQQLIRCLTIWKTDCQLSCRL